VGKKYLDKLFKSGEIDKQMYSTTLRCMEGDPNPFLPGGLGDTRCLNDELLPFGKTYEAVLGYLKEVESYELLSNISAIIMFKEQNGGMDSLTQAERFVSVVQGMLDEVDNGGFNQFFFNSSGELAYDLVPALEAVGSTHFKAIASDALTIFGNIPSLDEASRYAHLEKITQDDELQLWDECDDKFYECDEQLEAMVLKYAESSLCLP